MGNELIVRNSQLCVLFNSDYLFTNFLLILDDLLKISQRIKAKKLSYE